MILICPDCGRNFYMPMKIMDMFPGKWRRPKFICSICAHPIYDRERFIEKPGELLAIEGADYIEDFGTF